MEKEYFVLFFCFLVLLTCIYYKSWLREKKEASSNENPPMVAKPASLLGDETNVIVLKPKWGLANRLRSIRKAYAISKILHRRLILVDHVDDGFDETSMQDLLKFKDIQSVHESVFKPIFKDRSEQGRVMYIKRDIHIGKCETIINEERMTRLKALSPNVIIYFKTCDFIFKDNYVHLNEDRSFYTEQQATLLHPSNSQEKNNTSQKIVGVHVRQGNLNDYRKGNFFAQWDNRDKTMKPFFPQFKDSRKNLSSVHSLAPPLENFMKVMDSYDESVKFFVCSDRIGTLIYLYQKYPERVLLNPLVINTDLPDSKQGLKDFTRLSQCDEIIATGIGSFSVEAALVNNVPIKQVWNIDIVT